MYVDIFRPTNRFISRIRDPEGFPFSCHRSSALLPFTVHRDPDQQNKYIISELIMHYKTVEDASNNGDD